MRNKLINTVIRKIELINELKIEGPVELNANYKTRIGTQNEDKQHVLVETQFELNGTQKTDATSYLKLELCIDGLFELENEVANMDELNSALRAAMFPYIRAYVATVTAVAGLPSVNLPDMTDQ